MTALMKAIRKNDVAVVRDLIGKGADVDQLDENKDAPLVMASYLGHADIVRLLLKAGADVAAVDPEMKATALHAAAYAGRAEVAKLLVEGGVDIDRQGPRNGYTALHDAVWQGNTEVVSVLVDAGAGLQIRSRDGQTALDLARAEKRAGIARLIETATARGGGRAQGGLS